MELVHVGVVEVLCDAWLSVGNLCECWEACVWKFIVGKVNVAVILMCRLSASFFFQFYNRHHNAL